MRGHLALRQGTASPAPLISEWVSEVLLVQEYVVKRSFKKLKKREEIPPPFMYNEQE